MSGIGGDGSTGAFAFGAKKSTPRDPTHLHDLLNSVVDHHGVHIVVPA
jgi:hypothetical protein